jgi:Zinc-finger of C2H2 type
MSREQTMGGYRCDICDTTFNSPSDLDAHLREKHNMQIT